MLFLTEKLNEVINRGEGILSASLAPYSSRNYERLNDEVNLLLEGGLNQLLIIHYVPENMKLAEIAPLERKFVLRNYKEEEAYTDMGFDNIAEIHRNHPDLPIIDTPHFSATVTYGVERFIRKCEKVGVAGWDSVGYQVVEDPCGYRKKVEKHNIGFIGCVSYGGLDLNNEEHRQRVDRMVKASSGELYVVPAVPGSSDGIKGELVRPVIQYIRESMVRQNNLQPIVCIGGIASPEDAYQCVQVAGANGVHYSSAFMKKVVEGESRENIVAWLRETKAAMKK